jgi:Plasmid pRiA4b ORF-3-like protein
MPNSKQLVIYQLKIFILDISPMIWRRVKVRSDSTIADLHYIIQIAMGWTDSHLHRFVIHGKDYGVAQIGGINFTDDPTEVKLADFGWKVKEKFLYEYDFGDFWQHQIRVEAILTSKSKSLVPVCVTGKGACPPEDCGGAERFMAQKQHYSTWYISERLEAIEEEIEAEEGEMSDYIEEIDNLRRWQMVNHFDRERVNSRLQQYATGDSVARLFELMIG